MSRQYEAGTSPRVASSMARAQSSPGTRLPAAHCETIGWRWGIPAAAANARWLILRLARYVESLVRIGPER